ncbi:response regulator [Aliamphritea hakodatensis]|uniref:response regulator n=1 Tax=Aliamphritea hakodatensis TaxID=2895352 RepID=UPI0022FD9547|nr:response regulator [Aliamphritea hakodatensis]
MATPLLICDDSSLARKQIARSLPDNLAVDVSFATHGGEALDAIRAGKGDVLLLDLNMPVMDGYQVLEAIQREDLPTMVIVISGDIQPSAYQRVKKLGALDFIKKPVDQNTLNHVLLQYGVFSDSDFVEEPVTETPATENTSDVQLLNASGELSARLRDCYQEVANIAMGRAGDLLARLLNVFVMLPVPNVNYIAVSEVSMALSAIEADERISGVCQGFIGGGISGEALLILNDSSFLDLAALMNYSEGVDEQAELELLMDVANVLIGACLGGISEQLDFKFSQGHPVVLGQHCHISDLMDDNIKTMQKTLAIEISYGIEGHAIKCDLLLLFTEKSMQKLNEKVSHLLD